MQQWNNKNAFWQLDSTETKKIRIFFVLVLHFD